MASRIKPQIAKEYVSTLAVGRPDLAILEQEFEEQGEHDHVFEGEVSYAGCDGCRSPCATSPATLMLTPRCLRKASLHRRN